MTRISRLLLPLLIGIAVASAISLPRLLDYALGVVFLAYAAQGLWGFSDRRGEEPAGAGASATWRVMGVGILGMFGGGSIAWGWITAARVASGVVGLGLLAMASPWSRERRDDEAMGCAVLLGLFAVTGWLGMFPTYLEQAVWPGTPAGGTARGVAGYLLWGLAGLVLVGAAFAGSRRPGEGAWSPRWAAVVALLGFGVWLGGALYWCGAWSAEDER